MNGAALPALCTSRIFPGTSTRPHPGAADTNAGGEMRTKESNIRQAPMKPLPTPLQLPLSRLPALPEMVTHPECPSRTSRQPTARDRREAHGPDVVRSLKPMPVDPAPPGRPALAALFRIFPPDLLAGFRAAGRI